MQKQKQSRALKETKVCATSGARQRKGEGRGRKWGLSICRNVESESGFEVLWNLKCLFRGGFKKFFSELFEKRFEKVGVAAPREK